MPTRRTSQADNPWPLGPFVRSQRGRMSIREAARRANISESRWRQVEAGVQKLAGGIEVPVHPRAETVAGMCEAVSADVRTGLELAGHDPEEYAWLIESRDLGNDANRDWFTGLPRADREAVLAELQRLHVDTELDQAQGRKPRRSAG
jgi:hypothetical protein